MRQIGLIRRALRRRRLAAGLFVLEVAMGLTVSVHAYALGQWMWHLSTVPLTADDTAVFGVTVEMLAGSPDDPEWNAGRVEADEEALRAVPGVVGAVGTFSVPGMLRSIAESIEPAGPPDPARQAAIAWDFDGNPALLDLLGIPIVAGRGLVDRDRTRDRPTPVLLSVGLATRLFPDGPAVGRRIICRARRGICEVVGVTGPFRALTALAPHADWIVYYARTPLASRTLTYVVRSTPEAHESTPAAIEAALLQAEPRRVVRVDSVAEYLWRGTANSRGARTMFLMLVVCVLLVAQMGALGIASFLVAERRKQIGVRRALGARKRDIVSYFMIESTLLTVRGLAIGLLPTWVMGRLVAAQVPELALDWRVVGAMSGLFLLTGMLASLSPALRAARLPPTVATRS